MKIKELLGLGSEFTREELGSVSGDKPPHPQQVVVMDMIKEELAKMGPLAKQILREVVLHGGNMDHVDIVKALGPQKDADIRDAFSQCRASKLIYDQAPGPFNQKQTWYAAPAMAADLRKQVEKF